MLKVSFICTVFNEENTLLKLLDSLLLQTKVPDETIIVDGDSKDKTFDLLKQASTSKIYKKLNIRFFKIKGNRSIGRNLAIQNAKYPIIVCSDAGCILDKNWCSKITSPFEEEKIDVVAGYYRGKTDSLFQKAQLPYVFVMENKLNSKTFLPSSRSMAFTKKIWHKIGGFPKEFSHNEDYVFANRLKKSGAKITFVKEAIVYWLPKSNLKELYIMFYRFARGDIEASLIRPKVILIFLRYLMILTLLIIFIYTKSLFIGFCLLLLIILYILWSIQKNYQYILNPLAFYLLPLFQVTSDVAVISGSLRGLFK